MTNVKSLHIVIAEDDFDDADIVQQSFESNGNFTKIELVKNGQELLNLLRNCSSCPDVILTDINMPIMSGIEALREIYKDPALTPIPCFVYSTSINPTYEAQCKELGVKGFFIKPYSFEEFNNIPAVIVEVLTAGQ